MTLPHWHESGFEPQDVISLPQISDLTTEISYSALRSYSTGRRLHWWLGSMPDAVAYIANRRLWLRVEIDAWLQPLEIPNWRRNKAAALKLREGTVSSDVRHRPRPD